MAKKKEPYEISHRGVGFFGFGQYKSSEGNIKTESYSAWCRMLERCYSEKFQARKPSYKGCEVHPKWHNFQLFAEWYNGQEFSGLGYHLDKDLLAKGSKVYSEDTCCLIPMELNSLISIKRRKGIEGLPIGVHMDSTGKKYTSSVGTGKERLRLGVFDCKFEAHNKYIEEKLKMVKKKAEIYKSHIDSKVFDALMNFEILSEEGAQVYD